VGAKLLHLILKAAGKRGFKKAWGICRSAESGHDLFIERQRESEVTPVENGQKMKLLVD